MLIAFLFRSSWHNRVPERGPGGSGAGLGGYRVWADQVPVWAYRGQDSGRAAKTGTLTGMDGQATGGQAEEDRAAQRVLAADAHAVR